MGRFTEFGSRTGFVDLIDWDLAVIKQTGAILDEVQNEWYLPLGFVVEEADGTNVEIEKALVVYKRPEPTQVQHVVPQLALIRDDIHPADDRLYSTTIQYRLPAEGATRVSVDGVLGWTTYETREKDEPYNFTYTVECWARYKTVAQTMLQMMMAAFPLRGKLSLWVQEQPNRNVYTERVYPTFQEGVANLTEVNSMVERIPGWGVTFRVEGELTQARTPSLVPAFTGPLSPTPSPIGPGGPGGNGPGGGPGNADYPNGNPNLPGGGLYGTGLPYVRATVLED